MKGLASLVLTCIMAASTLVAQSNQWMYYSASGNVHNIALESNSLWSACIGGLYSIDLNTSQQTFYNKANTPMQSHRVNTIAIDTDGAKWVGTENGLYRFYNNQWENIPASGSGLPGNSIKSISIDAQQQMDWHHIRPRKTIRDTMD